MHGSTNWEKTNTNAGQRAAGGHTDLVILVLPLVLSLAREVLLLVFGLRARQEQR